LSWLAASILAIGCRYVVSFDGFASGGEPGPAAGNGGASGGDGGNGGMAGSTGGQGGSLGGSGQDMDGAIRDVRTETPPIGPIPVYTAPMGATLRGIALHGSDLYWVECCAGRGLFKMPGGESGMAIPVQFTENAFDVAVDASSIYWSEGKNSFQVFQMPISGGTVSPYFPHNAMSPTYITVDDAAVVYVTTEGGSIISGIAGPSMHLYAAQTGIAGIAFYASADAGGRDVYWGYNAGIRYATTKGGGIVKDVWTGGTNESAQGVATDGQDLFWISDNKSIKKSELAIASPGPTSCINPPQDLGANADIAVNDRWIYFTWPNRNAIYRCLK
jgi:hypothetical protein